AGRVYRDRSACVPGDPAAHRHGRPAGTLGDVGTVSFYPAHHMTLGEGGAVFTGNGRIKRALASLRDWGRDCWCESGKSDTCGRRFGWKLGLLPEGYDHKYIYSHMGYNLKALDLQAAIGLEQLKKLPGFIRSRNANFARLKKGLSPFEDVLRLPETYPGAEPSWFALPLTVREDAPFTRRDIVGHLESRRIETRMLFAGNILKQPAYCAVPHRLAGDLGNTDAVMERSFFVGVYPGLVPEALDYMVECFTEFIRKAKAKSPRPN
ncbi:MAG: DegT/DnrJ/EryC1/StrS family aminotransferase, partial [Elusimicrobiota bacterium]